MYSTLHITNGDSAAGGIRTADGAGDVLPWRDILHEGPVPAGLSLSELSSVRAAFLAQEKLGRLDDLERSFAERDDMLRRFGDHDEVVTLDRFPDLYAARREVSLDMLTLARSTWQAFRSADPRAVEVIARENSSSLEFLPGALMRHLEELPSVRNGLSRSELQILEAVSQRPLSFAEIFKRTANREERIFCGDATMARYIERMSRHPSPLLTYPSGETIDAPRTEEDSSAFRNAEIALTAAGREVLRGDSDWIEMGGTDRWLGGVHLKGSEIRWRWDGDEKRVVAVEERHDA